MTRDWFSDYSDWLSARMPMKEGKPNHWITCGVLEDGEVIGVVALFNWMRGKVAYFGGAGDDPRFMSRELIKDILQCAFEQIEAKKLVAFTDPENSRTQKILTQFGFEYRETVKDGFGEGLDKLVYELDESVGRAWLERLGRKL